MCRRIVNLDEILKLGSNTYALPYLGAIGEQIRLMARRLRRNEAAGDWRGGRSGAGSMTNRQARAPEKVGRRRDPGRWRLRIYVSWRSGRVGRMVGKVARRPDRQGDERASRPAQVPPTARGLPPSASGRPTSPRTLDPDPERRRRTKRPPGRRQGGSALLSGSSNSAGPFLVHSLILDARSEYQAAEETRKLDSGSPS